MGKTSGINLAAFGSRLSPPALAVFRSLYENARDIIVADGPRASYEKPLAELMDECGIVEAESVADSIREIIQRRIDYKTGEYQFFLGFFASVQIENGQIKYSLPKEIEGAMPQARMQDNC